MLREVIFTSICFVLLSGCALTQTSDVNVETQNAESPASVPQPQPTVNESADIARNESTNTAPVGDEPRTPTTIEKTVGSDYVRRIQARLKDSGFYSGAVDGIVGAKTQSAIRRFKSGCATLKDLIPNPGARWAKQMPTATAVAATKKSAATDGIRLVQVRLKDAGFNPGPIDGIRGIKTESALLALQSGCTMLQDFSAADHDTQSASEGHALSAPGVSASVKAPALAVESSAGKPAKKSGRQATKALQLRLREAGFDAGPIDGILGPKTKTALQQYELSSH